MNTFSWFLVGHLIGDFILQSDWMAIGKKNGLVTLPGMTHFLVYTLTILTAYLFAGGDQQGYSFWLVLGATVFISHWIIDTTSFVDRWMRFAGQKEKSMLRLMVDQTLHLLVLAVLAALAPTF